MPFVEEAMQNVEPLLAFEFDDNIKALAGDVYSEVIRQCRKSGQNPQVVQNLVVGYAQKILELWKKGQEQNLADPTSMSAQAESLGMVLEAAESNVLSPEQVSLLGNAALFQLNDSLSPEDIAARDADDAEAEHDLQLGLVKLLEALMKHHGSHFEQSVMQGYSKLLEKCIVAKDPDFFRVGLWMSADFLEYLPEKAIAAWPVLLPKLTDTISVKRLGNEVQPAAFALSLLVKRPEFGQQHGASGGVQQLAEKCLLYSKKVLSTKKSVDTKKIAASDNCLACLGNLLEHQGVYLKKSEFFGEWIRALPLREDAEESAKVHGLVADLALRQDPEILKHLSETLRVLTSVYDTNFSCETVNTKIKMVIGQASTEMLESCCRNFPDKLQKKARRIFNDCKKGA